MQAGAVTSAVTEADSGQCSLFRDGRVGLACMALTVALCTVWIFWQPDNYRPIGYIHLGQLALPAAIYLSAGRAALSVPDGRWRSTLFAVTNLAALAMFYGTGDGKRKLVFFLAAHLAMVSVHYVLMRRWAEANSWHVWLAFFSPIAALAAVRYLDFAFAPLWKAVPGIISTNMAAFFIGLSYLSFRLSYLVLEVRNGIVPKPSYSEYVGFAFFLPTFLIGPINPYRNHWESLERPNEAVTPLGRSLLRILIGLTKYYFFGNVFHQLSYHGLLLDGHPHAPIDLVVAAVSYHLYLYCNFAGFTDMAIGAAGLLGIHVQENFRNPLAARNLQEYWTRWHISLSSYMREVVFAPLSKWLTAIFGSAHANHAAAAAIVVVFLLIGVWHGVGWHYAIYGAIHAVGVVTVHYYNTWLKKALGRERYRAYHENRWIRAASVALTFSFVTASMFFFANDLPTMKSILRAVQF